jgi:E3 ubiquitin-protein ligase RNF14
MARIVAEYEGDRLFHAYMLENNNCECPRCQAPIEKTMGCNKMTCLICKTFFCFLCGSVLSSADPYSHYSERNLPCFQKLFEGTDIEAAMREEDLIRFAFD